MSVPEAGVGTGCGGRRVWTREEMLAVIHDVPEDDSDGGMSGDDERDEGVGGGNVVESDSDSECDSDAGGPGDATDRQCKEEKGRDGTVWTEQPPGTCRGKARPANRVSPSPTLRAKANITSPLSSLMCLIDTEMWQQMLKCTQAEADRNNAEMFNLSMEELKAFVGLLYYRGIMFAKSMRTDDYWSTEFGHSVFKETMSRQTFRSVMRYLRFDDKNTRASRLPGDKFAMISEIFDKFVKNSIASYTPGENITVDEQLFPTKAKCRFTQYMANKPDKFGIKFWVAVDVDSKYILNAHPYLGKDESRPAGPRSCDYVVLRLMEPFLGQGRNVTTDTYFTSLPLANTLLANKTTIVGTMSKTRPEMPPCTRAQTERFSSKVLRSGYASLTVYQARRKKKLCLLSTLHQTVSTDDGPKKLPETVSHYNSAKSAVDGLDQMARSYTVKGGTRRWPVAVFYNILDLAAINAHILYRQCTDVKISRRRFIHELARDLCAPLRIARLALAAAAPVAHRRPQPLTPSPPPSPPLPVKRKKCQVGRCKGNKTCDVCVSCRRLVCGKCAKPTKFCLEC